MQRVHRALDQAGHGQIPRPGDDVVALIDGDQDPCGGALPHRCRGFGGDLPQHGVGNDDADGSHDDICLAAADTDGVFTGSGLIGAGTQHGGGRRTVGTHGQHPHAGALCFYRRDQLAAQSAALAVNDQNRQTSSPFLSRGIIPQCEKKVKKMHPALVSGSGCGQKSLDFPAVAWYTYRVSAGVLELADETDSKSVAGNSVWVRPPPPAPKIPNATAFGIFTSYLLLLTYYFLLITSSLFPLPFLSLFSGFLESNK